MYSLNPLELYNFIFAAPLFLAVLFVGFQALMGLDDGGDMDFDADMDVDVDVDLDVDVDVDDGGDMGFKVLGLLNLDSRCPVIFGISLLFLLWGFTGYLLNSIILRNIEGSFTPWLILIAVISLVVGVFGVRLIAPLVARSLPSGQTSITKFDLVRKTASVSTLLIPGGEGNVVVHTEESVITVRAFLDDEDETATLKRGDKVLLIDYEPKAERYLCVPFVSED